MLQQRYRNMEIIETLTTNERDLNFSDSLYSVEGTMYLEMDDAQIKGVGRISRKSSLRIIFASGGALV